jgi:hypothetical protein
MLLTAEGAPLAQTALPVLNAAAATARPRPWRRDPLHAAQPAQHQWPATRQAASFQKGIAGCGHGTGLQAPAVERVRHRPVQRKRAASVA